MEFYEEFMRLHERLRTSKERCDIEVFNECERDTVS